MKILIVVAAIIAAMVLIAVFVGWMLPIHHHATRQATMPVPPAAVFEAITNVEEFPKWRSKVKSVEIVATETRQRAFRETGSDGSILFVIDESVPRKRLVSRIADPSLPFGGMWTYELTPAAEATTLRITEDGEVYNPIFRFVSRFVFGHNATIDGYLTDLGRKFRTAAEITA